MDKGSHADFRILTRLFTRPTFAALQSAAQSSKALRFLKLAGLVESAPHGSQPLSQFFDLAFDRLFKSYRTEYVYKSAIANKLLFGKHSPRTAAMQVELPIGRSIVDIAIFNGTSTAYEIKTEFDTPRRIPTQTSDYLKVFDKVYVVTTADNAVVYERTLSTHVGLLTLSRTGSIQTYRPALSNAANIDSRSVFRCLRQKEFVAAIESKGLSADFPTGLIRSRCEGIFESFPSSDAHASFVSCMRARTSDSQTIDFVSRLPRSLRALGYATPLTFKQRENLLSVLSSPSPYAW